MLTYAFSSSSSSSFSNSSSTPDGGGRARPDVVALLAAKMASARAAMPDALWCSSTKDNAVANAAQAVEGFIAPWVTGSSSGGSSSSTTTSVAGYRCAGRFAKDGTWQADFNPSFVDGDSYGGTGGHDDDFGDDDTGGSTR